MPAEGCDTSSRLGSNKSVVATRQALSDSTFWPSGPLVRRPYSPHYTFADHRIISNSWLAQYAAWHGGTLAFLDVGGRDSKASRGVLPALAAYEYWLLERDTERATKTAHALNCDLYDCPAAACKFDVVHSRYVIEHLVSPERAMTAMASFVKPGGLLITVAPWTARYHAEDTYGNYMQLSARALEHLCITNGLNPVRAGFDNGAQRDPDKDGVRKQNVLDRTPFIYPGRAAFNTFAVCYKPRPGERRVPFVEVGQLPTELFPRFEVRFGATGSEHSGADTVFRTRARLLPPGGDIRSPTACLDLQPGELVVVLEGQNATDAAKLEGSIMNASVSNVSHVSVHRGEDGIVAYRGPSSYVELSDGSVYRAATYGRC